MRRDPEKVVEELAGIEEEYVFFADDESLLDVARMTRLAGLIREAGIRKRYFCYGRSDTITRNPELLRIWRDVGLERVFVGLEFFRDEDLDYIRKNATTADNETAIRILQGLGIEVYASFMVRQEFTREDFAALKAYCRRLGLNFASFAVLTPLPGTDLYTEVENRLITRDCDLFDFLHTQLPTTLPLKEFFKECDGLYTYAIPPGKQISLLRKYQPGDVLGLLGKTRRFHKRLRNAHLDY